MANNSKTTRKLPKKPFTGEEGNSFSSTNQPSSELKKKGWEEWRKQRNLTQAVIKYLIGETDAEGKPIKFNEYVESLVMNAQAGNATAIGAVNKCLEDEIIKVAATNAAGEDVPHIVGMIVK